MYAAIARGGPLDGVKITAPGTWDGMIRKELAPAHAQASKYFHAGRYVWIGFEGWTWFPGKFETLASYRPDSTRNWRLVIE